MWMIVNNDDPDLPPQVFGGYYIVNNDDPYEASRDGRDSHRLLPTKPAATSATAVDQLQQRAHGETLAQWHRRHFLTTKPA